jgi:hypothetical protein
MRYAVCILVLYGVPWLDLSYGALGWGHEGLPARRDGGQCALRSSQGFPFCSRCLGKGFSDEQLNYFTQPHDTTSIQFLGSLSVFL